MNRTRSPLLILLVVALSATFAADQSIDKRVEKHASCDNCAVEIRSAVGQLVVETGSADQVRAVAELEFWSSDRSWVERVEQEFDIEIETSGDRVRIVVDLPQPPNAGMKKWLKGKKVRYEIDLRVYVPEHTPIDVDNQYGSVSVRDIGGRVVVANQSGDVDVRGAMGPVEVDARYGSIQLADVRGPLRAQTTSGNVEALEITGPVEIDAKYGSVEVERLGGHLNVRATSGNVVARDVKGTAFIRGAYGSVIAEKIQGELEVTTTSGDIEVSDVGQQARLDSSYGSVEAAHIGGDLRMTTSSGDAEAMDVRGDLLAESSHGSVRAEDIEGSAEISTSSGNVSVERIKGGLRVTCSHGRLRVREIGGALMVEASNTGVQAADVAGAVEIDTSYAGVSLDRVGGGRSRPQFQRAGHRAGPVRGGAVGRALGRDELRRHRLPLAARRWADRAARLQLRPDQGLGRRGDAARERIAPDVRGESWRRPGLRHPGGQERQRRAQRRVTPAGARVR